jgi:SAM-dependent methyltransferase
MSPAVFRDLLAAVPPTERDAWVDRLFGIDALPDDGPELPRGCVAYLPCSVDAVLRMVEQARVTASDVFVDVGSGLGRAAALVHLLTGAAAVGVEIQSHLVRAARELATRLGLSQVSVVQGDAALASLVSDGSVYFLYCPFGADRVERFLDELAPIARTRPIRVCSLDLPLPPRAWLEPVAPSSGDLAVYRSVRGSPPQK